MRVSWREVLGLLVGLAMCYAVISYALVYAPQLREMAAEQTEQDPRRGAIQERTDRETTGGETKTLTLRITGSTGEAFGANYGTRLTSRTVEGTTPTDYEVEVNTDTGAADYITATAWKTAGNSKELKVQLLENGRVLKETSTTKDYGATGVRYSPNEAPPPERTTPGAEKTAEKTKDSTKLEPKPLEKTRLQP